MRAMGNTSHWNVLIKSKPELKNAASAEGFVHWGRSRLFVGSSSERPECRATLAVLAI